MAKAQQIPLEFDVKPYYGREDFMVATSNVEAVRVVDEWPQWSNFAICIYGHEGSGKTHIAHMFIENVYKKTNALHKISVVKAMDVNMNNIERFFDEHNCLVVEDLDENIDNEAMFHLYNLYKNEGGFILFTSKEPPARMKFGLADLQSRLNSIPAIELKEPSSDLLSMVVVKLFADRQLVVSPEVVSYIINNARRSFAYVKRLVAEIDRVSIARKRAVTIPVVKEAMEYLDDDKQEELF